MKLTGHMAGAADRSEREREARNRAGFDRPGRETVVAERQLDVGEQLAVVLTASATAAQPAAGVRRIARRGRRRRGARLIATWRELLA